MAVMTSPRTVAAANRTADVLERCPLFAGVSRRDVTDILAQSSLRHVEQHQDIYEEGDPSRGLWVVLQGRVRLHHRAADGREVVAGFRAPSDALDLSAALDGRPHMATASAMENGELVLVPRSVLSCLWARHPILLHNAIDLLCLEVRQRDIRTAVAVLKDAHGRIGCTLLQLARQFGQASTDGIRIDFPLTRRDVADRSGVTVETAIRVMSELQQRGAIRTTMHVIELVDVEAIRHMCLCAECPLACAAFSPGGR